VAIGIEVCPWWRCSDRNLVGTTPECRTDARYDRRLHGGSSRSLYLVLAAHDDRLSPPRRSVRDFTGLSRASERLPRSPRASLTLGTDVPASIARPARARFVSRIPRRKSGCSRATANEACCNVA
jgi:hypothetical protein